MTLDLIQVQPQVQEMGQALHKRAAAREAALPRALQAFEQLAELDPSSIDDKIDLAAPTWRGARPRQETLHTSQAPASAPNVWNVIAADGSQIYLDRHRALPYYAINIGSLHLSYGRDTPPRASSHPTLFHEESDLYDEQGHFVTPNLVNARRDSAEMEELARLAQLLQGRATLVLLDNTLSFRYGNLDPKSYSGQALELLKSYLSGMDTLHACGAMLAGYIDRPTSNDLLSTISLIAWNVTENRFRELTDRDLMAAVLPTGHRSAVFRLRSPGLHELQIHGHGVNFFYINSGGPESIARVEVPNWVAENPKSLELVHACLLKECEAAGGYPYSLIRAHELALISESERSALDQWLTGMAIQHGLHPQPSRKAATKRWLGNARRHHL
jgi:hypothetical protein